MIGSVVGAWLSLVERLVRDQEAGGSNPLAPTNYEILMAESVRAPGHSYLFIHRII